MGKKKPHRKIRSDLKAHRLVIWLPADIYPEQIERVQIELEED